MPYTVEDCVPARQESFARKTKKLEPALYALLRQRNYGDNLSQVTKVPHKREEKKYPIKKDTKLIHPVDHTLNSNRKREREPEREIKQEGNIDTTKKTKTGRKAREQNVFQVPLYLHPLKIPSKPFVRA